MSKFTHACCEACWINTRGTWSAVADGEKLVGVPIPVRVVQLDQSIERCCLCGAPTIVGIYVRADPALYEHCGGHEDE